MSSPVNNEDSRIIAAFVANAFEVAEVNSAKLELELNEFGYYPLASSFTALVRGVHGVTQVVAGLAKGIFSIIADLFATHRYGIGVVKGFSFATHGVLNIARAFIEVFPGVGNVAIIVRDIALPRFKYSVENEQVILPGNIIKKAFLLG